MKDGFYTVGEEPNEVRIGFAYDKDGNVSLFIGTHKIQFENQQLGEFACLLLALSNMDDVDSVPELLEGYEPNALINNLRVQLHRLQKL
jgi:hypothetical protein